MNPVNLNTEFDAVLADLNDRTELLFLWNEYILRHRFKNDWERMLSHVFNERNPRIYQKCAVVRGKEGILAAGCMVPMVLRLKGVAVDAGVLTGIVTRPESRRQGLMAKINQRLIALMGEQKIPVSILWGFRDRYQKFGFEICGKRNKYFIPARKLGDLAQEDRLKIRPISLAKDKALLTSIARVENLSVKGLRDSYLDLFVRGNVTTLIYEDARFPAVVAFNAETLAGAKQLDVFYHAGHFESVKKILTWLKINSLFVDCVALTGRTDLERSDEAFFSFYEWFHTEHICNLRINDFTALMKTLEPRLQSAIDALGCKIQLKMKRGNNVQAWTGIPRNIKEQFEIELTDLQMVRLLFGPERPWELPFIGEKGKVLDSLFPIPFYISPFEGA